MRYNPMVLTDFYKTSHRQQYPEGTEAIFANWIPRTSRKDGIEEVVVFGVQKFIKEYVVDYFRDNFFSRDIDEICAEYERFMKFTVGEASSDHIRELHAFGYLPIQIYALPEGTLCPIGVPCLTIMNTEACAFWVVNYLETLASTELWLPMTSATIAYSYRKILDKWALKTTGSTEGVQFQGHDFSMRGMGTLGAAVSSGMGHLTSFVGTDTMPAISALEYYYGANIEDSLVGCSVPATEHSVQCVNGTKSIEEETTFLRKLITEIHPTGIVSMVSDTINLWDLLTVALPEVKDAIVSRDGKFVVRPDSGDPVDILCGRGDIIDLTDEKYVDSLEDATGWMQDLLVDTEREAAGHGELGNEEVKGTFRYEGKQYHIVISIEWNRYDKQFYFIDEYRVEYLAELPILPEDKGVVEILWDLFGGTINDQGYKVLDSHIGAIYGDSITLERAEEICKRLEAKGFASTNVVLGIGSYSYQYNTRDTFGFAMKTTWAKVGGEEHQVFKNPITDDGTKKSLKGLCIVSRDEEGLSVADELSYREWFDLDHHDELELVYHNGIGCNFQTLEDVRNTLGVL